MLYWVLEIQWRMEYGSSMSDLLMQSPTGHFTGKSPRNVWEDALSGRRMLSESLENRTDGTEAQKYAYYWAEQEKSKRDVVGIRRGRIRDKIRGGYIESWLSKECDEPMVLARLLFTMWLGNLWWDKAGDIYITLAWPEGVLQICNYIV